MMNNRSEDLWQNEEDKRSSAELVQIATLATFQGTDLSRNFCLFYRRKQPPSYSGYSHLEVPGTTITRQRRSHKTASRPKIIYHHVT